MNRHDRRQQQRTQQRHARKAGAQQRGACSSECNETEGVHMILGYSHVPMPPDSAYGRVTRLNSEGVCLPPGTPVVMLAAQPALDAPPGPKDRPHALLIRFAVVPE